MDVLYFYLALINIVFVIYILKKYNRYVFLNKEEIDIIIVIGLFFVSFVSFLMPVSVFLFLLTLILIFKYLDIKNN